jgi:hypothetical protein
MSTLRRILALAAASAAALAFVILVAAGKYTP